MAIFTSAGLTLGLALQGSLSNFAGGVLILLLKPFRVGDYIIDGSSSSEGTVHSIDLFYTTLITIDNRVVVIPNGALSNSSLVNVTSRKERLLILSVGVAYSTELKKAKEVILRCAALTQGTVINEEKPVRVIVDTLGDSSIVLQVRVWVETSQYLSAKSDLNEKIIDAFREEKISIPFPQLDVHMQ